jgi:uroporphyrin-III C-methyltransferase/precorrin-2 dehydrogenase/sirohydrochlorin ferrochelatase
MIVDLDLTGRHLLLLGGERETERKAHMYLDAGANVTLICPFFPESLEEARSEGRLTYVEGDLAEDLSLLERVALPVHAVVIATAWDEILEAVADYKERNHALLYVVDGAEHSDFIQPALRVVDTVQVAVATDGKSPVMAAQMAERFARQVTKTDVALCYVHDAVRLEAMRRGMGALDRRDLLRELAEDPAIRTLLEEGRLEEAKAQALSRLPAEAPAE